MDPETEKWDSTIKPDKTQRKSEVYLIISRSVGSLDLGKVAWPFKMITLRETDTTRETYRDFMHCLKLFHKPPKTDNKISHEPFHTVLPNLKDKSLQI